MSASPIPHAPFGDDAPGHTAPGASSRKADAPEDPPLDVETVFEGNLPVALHAYNELLLRHEFEPSVFDSRPTFLQLNGKPELEEAMAPERRAWMHGASPAGSAVPD